ncbi:MAG TPA: hypothetical protein VFL47_16755, partial [Flavisolibacter sp.]|nr:hypothetical protein [Flavisolibacter sp.]
DVKRLQIASDAGVLLYYRFNSTSTRNTRDQRIFLNANIDSLVCCQGSVIQLLHNLNGSCCPLCKSYLFAFKNKCNAEKHFGLYFEN